MRILTLLSIHLRITFDNDTIATRYLSQLADHRSHYYTWLVLWIGGRLKRVTESIELMLIQPADTDNVVCIWVL